MKCIEHISNKQRVLRIRLLKAYRPVRLENAQSTWVHGMAYIFRTNERPKVKESCFKTERDVVAVDSTGKMIGTMKQLYRPICGGTSTLERGNFKV